MSAVQSQLHGRRILIVEDEPLVALEVAAALDQSGAVVIGCVGRSSDAIAVLNVNVGQVDGVVLDINLHGAPSFDVAELLTERAIPFVFATAFGAKSVPARYCHVPLLTKPFHLKSIINSLAEQVARPVEQHPH